MAIEPTTVVTEIRLKFLEWQKLYEVEKPFQIFIDIPKDADDQRDTNLVFKTVAVTAKDVRGHEAEYNIDTHGFMYRPYTTTFADYTNIKAVESQYLPEIETLLKRELTGVDRVFFFDWRVCLMRLFTRC
jgi:hypothetical protein